MAFRSGKQRGKAANQQAAAKYTANEDTSSLLRQMLGVGASTSHLHPQAQGMGMGMGGDPQRMALIARMPQTLAQFSFDRDSLLACMAPFLQSEPR
jgi:N-acetylglucosamine kinase-like BadF-type ATPase